MQAPVDGPFTEARPLQCQTCFPASTPLSCVLHPRMAAPIFSAAILHTRLDEPSVVIFKSSRALWRLCLPRSWLVSIQFVILALHTPTKHGYRPVDLKKPHQTPSCALTRAWSCH